VTHRKLAALIVAAACAVPMIAEAGVRVRVGGRVVIRNHRAPHVVVVTRRPRPRLHISGHVYVGGGYVFAEPPPPPPPDCYSECGVPAYPTTTYTPPPPVVVGAPYEPFGPRLGIGVFAGTTKLEGTETGDIGLTGRLRLTRGLSLEGELAKARADEVESRRAGIGLSWDLSPRSRLSPHLLGMMGRWDEANYAEIGAGLTYRLSDRLSINADLRAGALEEAEPVRDGGIAYAGGGGTANNEPLQYTRGRIGAMLMF
jgi:hypothetical protein